jgi:heat shock protein HslJ
VAEPRAAWRRLAAVPNTIRSRTVLAIGVVAIAVLATALAGCSTAAPNLSGREFLSVEVSEGGAPKALVAGTRISLRFDQRDLGANAGCNGLGGTYRIELGKLVYEPGGQTLMGCEPPLEAQDGWLIAFLDSDPMVVLAGNELLMTSGAISMRLLDREVAEPDLNISGPLWTVESIIEGDTASSVPEGATATILFKADGTVEVDAGCNRGSGTWRLEGAGIRVEALALTKMACQGPGARLEGAVLSVLDSDVIQAQIESNVLTLTGGNAGLQLRGT